MIRASLLSLPLTLFLNNAFSRETGCMKRPNILYIHSHDTGRYVQPYGARMNDPDGLSPNEAPMVVTRNGGNHETR